MDVIFLVAYNIYNVFRVSVFDHEYQGKYDAVGHALFYLDNISPSNDEAQSVKLYKNSWVRSKIISLINYVTNVHSGVFTVSDPVDISPPTQSP